ncbi:NADAR family protein [uncultured Draconibacterium sp.]|uniref:NADAR family protein n=1 Tax=uncultured Draconibacterium sp. TaxID=1573823 RepID=UPI0029C68F3F|nr:NADAR family protein [uncultured Draconibacterium sp.]
MIFKYNVNHLKEQERGILQCNCLFFYSNSPEKIGKVDSSCLSQWYKCRFKYNGFIFQSTEQWMMLQKAIAFDDYRACCDIMQSETPKEAKEIGRKIRNFKEESWERYRYEIVVFGNILKFSQNKELGEYLLNTGNKVLVETSSVDLIWGVGMTENNPEITNPNNWRGKNLLGFALMEVRDFIRKHGFWTDLDVDDFDSGLSEIQDELHDLDLWGLHDYGESLHPLFAKGKELDNLVFNVLQSIEIIGEDEFEELEMVLSNVEENIGVIANFDYLPEDLNEDPDRSDEVAELRTAVQQLEYDLKFLSQHFSEDILHSLLSEAIKVLDEYKKLFEG